MARSAEQAAAEWVEAEWQFRLGPNAYSTPAQDFLLLAERRLRKAVTGQKDLGAAYEELSHGQANDQGR